MITKNITILHTGFDLFFHPDKAQESEKSNVSEED